MALTDDEITTLVKITRLTRAILINFYLPKINTSTENAIKADVVTWNASQNKFVKIIGGTDGIHYDPQELRDIIRERIDDLLEISRTGGGTYSGFTRLVRS